MRAKALASLHICARSPEPSTLDNAIKVDLSAIYGSTKGSCESDDLISLISFSRRNAGSECADEPAYMHSLRLRNSTLILCAISNGDLCAIYASNEGSGESAQLDFTAKLFPPTRMKAHMLMNIAGSIIFLKKQFCDIKK